MYINLNTREANKIKEEVRGKTEQAPKQKPHSKKNRAETSIQSPRKNTLHDENDLGKRHR